MVIKQNPEHDSYQSRDAERPEMLSQSSHGSQATQPIHNDAQPIDT